MWTLAITQPFPSCPTPLNPSHFLFACRHQRLRSALTFCTIFSRSFAYTVFTDSFVRTPPYPLLPATNRTAPGCLG